MQEDSNWPFDDSSKERRIIDTKTLCPNCMTRGNIREIVYGLLEPDFDLKGNFGGGCCVYEESPDVRCRVCSWEGKFADLPEDDAKPTGPRLISTGVVVQGHTSRFEYIEIDGKKRSFMECVCDWRDEIESFPAPHSRIESQRKFDRHLIALGIDPQSKKESDS
jgi:hypothetical protein